MRVSIGDAKIVGAKRDLLRFDVTFPFSDEAPALTVKGWLMRSNGRITPPMVFTGRMRQPSHLIQASDVFITALDAALRGSQLLRPLLDAVLDNVEAGSSPGYVEGIEVGEVVLGG